MSTAWTVVVVVTLTLLLLALAVRIVRRHEGHEAAHGPPSRSRTADGGPSRYAAGSPVTEALTKAVAAAGLAPSIHQPQPWKWRMTGDGLDLHLDSSRPLDATDPDGRLATLSCGAALHHARVSLGAQGWRATVTRMPDVANPEHLARIQADDPAPTPIEPLMVRREQTIGLRHTDRRALSGRRVGADALAAIITAVHAQGSLLHVLYPNQVLDLAAAADLAQGKADETGWLAELASWNAGPLPAGPHDRPALFAILYGRGDQPLNWLRAGEALSAAWLTATEIGVSLLPLSATIEMTHTREAIRVLLASVGYPYLVLRLRTTDQDDAGLARHPQLPFDQIPSPSRSA